MKIQGKALAGALSFLLFLLVCLLLGPARADENGIDYPHCSLTSATCDACHYMFTDNPLPDWVSADTPYDALCEVCHNDLLRTTLATHSSATTSDQYGAWAIECRTCHWPHHQMQLRTYGAASYVLTGTSTAIDAATLTMSGAGWEADQFNDYILIPDTDELSYSYLITDTTSDTLTVAPTVELAKVTAGDTFAIYYGKLIKATLPTPNSGDKTVRFFRKSGDNSYADGNATYDGVCEACHTKTRHFRNDGSAPDQLHTNVSGGQAGADCMPCHSHVGGFSHGGASGGTGCVACHGHDAGYEYSPGQLSQGRGTFKSHSTHTENDSDDLRGPNIGCDGCHDTDSFPNFKSGTDLNSDGRYNLAETDVCDTCHSPGGTYDGIDDATVGAKPNWAGGVYAGDALPAGKETWCATCHDEVPSVIETIPAPNVVGDEDGAYAYGTGWGYYKTGHGLTGTSYPWSGGVSGGAARKCDDCHDFSTMHIDGEVRTYDSSAGTGSANDYRKGYRLALVDGELPMALPRQNECGDPAVVDPADFRLCFKCHNSDPFTGASNNTNFKGGDNAHRLHLEKKATCGDGQRFSSDWDFVDFDSRISCVTCHNVHGSSQLSMVRAGALIGREPGLQLVYYNGAVSYLCGGPGAHDPTPQDVQLPDSTGTIWRPNGAANLCSSCHGSCGWDTVYSRAPYYDVTPPAIETVYGLVGSDTLAVEFSEGVFSDVGGSGGLTPADLVLTDADDGRTIAGVIHTAGDSFATISLSSALDGSADIGVDTLAAATAASVYDAGSNPMGTGAVAITGDSDPPTASSLVPGNGTTLVAINSNLAFTLADAASGVDWTTFSIDLAGDKGYSRTYTDLDTAVVSKTGSPASYGVTVDPDTDFGYGEVITVTVAASDLVGNALTPPAWSFTTIPGGGPFTMTIHPSGMPADGNPSSYTTFGGDWPDILDSNDGDTSYAYRCCGPGGEIFRVDMDDPAGLDTASIQSVAVFAYVRYRNGSAPDSTPFAADARVGFQTGAATIWGDVLTTDTSGSYNLVSTATFTTDSDGGPLDLADINSLQVAVDRNNPHGNNGAQFRVTEVYAVVTYGVPDGDETPPTIADRSPGNGVTDVAIDTNLTFTLADSGGGVDWTTFQIQLSGDKGYAKTYTDLDTSVVSKTGSMASYNVTVNPDANFANGEVITVTVAVDDRSGNALAPPAWSFTTEAASTPQVLTIHPTGVSYAGGFTVSGGDWDTVLDTSDGLTSHAHKCGGAGYPTDATSRFSVAMDDDAALVGTTVQSITIGVIAKYAPSCPTSGTASGTMAICYTTGGSTVCTDKAMSGDFTLYTASHTTDSDGGGLDPADIDNLVIEVQRKSGGSIHLIATEVYVEVTYIP